MSDKKGLDAWMPKEDSSEGFFGIDRSISTEQRAEIESIASQILSAALALRNERKAPSERRSSRK